MIAVITPEEKQEVIKACAIVDDGGNVLADANRWATEVALRWLRAGRSALDFARAGGKTVTKQGKNGKVKESMLGSIQRLTRHAAYFLAAEKRGDKTVTAKIRAEVSDMLSEAFAMSSHNAVEHLKGAAEIMRDYGMIDVKSKQDKPIPERSVAWVRARYKALAKAVTQETSTGTGATPLPPFNSLEILRSLIAGEDPIYKATATEKPARVRKPRKASGPVAVEPANEVPTIPTETAAA